jgi:hypothetical protein
MKELARKMAEDMIKYQEGIHERPVVKPKTSNMLKYFKQPAPEKPLGPEKTYEEFLQHSIDNKGSLVSPPCA